MASGGARARSGPPRDPNALRRDRPDDKAGYLVLPAEGRQGDAPDIPLSDPSSRELDLWRELWSTPQACEWDRLHLEREVAIYVRRYCEAEVRGAPASLSTLVKQLAEGLGLSIPGMDRNRWKIGDVEAESPGGVRRPSAKARLSVVTGGGGA